MNLTVLTTGAVVLAVIGLIFWAARKAAAAERAKAERDRAEAIEAAQQERLEMQGEAKTIDQAVDKMTNAEIDEELSKWSRPPH